VPGVHFRCRWVARSVVVGRLVIERSQVRLPAGVLSSSNSGQVVHTHVPLYGQVV